MLTKLQNSLGYSALIGRIIAVCIVVMAICVSALAGPIDGSGRHFFLSEKFKLDGAYNAQSFFLFSRGEINDHTGNIHVLGGEITISGTFRGDVYSFFANLRFVPSNSQKGTVHIFSSKVYAGYSSMDILPYTGNFDFLYKSYRVPTGMIYDNTIPVFWAYAFTMALDITIALILLSLKKSFFEQSGLALLHEPIRVLRNGIISYFTLLASAVIFMLSIIGFPVSAAIILITAVIGFAGLASMSYALGRICFKYFKFGNNDAYSNATIGVIIIEAVKLLPNMRWPMDFLIIPLLGVGTVSTGIINGFIKKKFYQSPDDADEPKSSGSSANLRKIILGE